MTIASVTALFGGVGLVAAARRHPGHEVALEWLGGLCLTGGLLLLGIALAHWGG